MTSASVIKGVTTFALGLGLLVGCDSDVNNRASDTGARDARVADRSANPSVADRSVTTGTPTTPGATAAKPDDAAIKTQVKAKLQDQAAAGLDRVNVESNDGVVRLTGTVQQPEMKERAAELARNIDGVRQVVNEIKVSA